MFLSRFYLCVHRVVETNEDIGEIKIWNPKADESEPPKHFTFDGVFGMEYVDPIYIPFPLIGFKLAVTTSSDDAGHNKSKFMTRVLTPLLVCIRNCLKRYFERAHLYMYMLLTALQIPYSKVLMELYFVMDKLERVKRILWKVLVNRQKKMESCLGASMTYSTALIVMMTLILK